MYYLDHENNLDNLKNVITSHMVVVVVVVLMMLMIIMTMTQ